MQQADVFVFPSFFEGLAIVQIEAQCSGLPLIATHESGASELIVEGKNGFLIPAGDVQALADRMRQLHSDPALRHAMSQAAIACRPLRSWTVYGDKWAALLKSLP